MRLFPLRLAVLFVPPILFSTAIAVLAQNTMSSGAAQKPQYDAQGRPITAGGFVESGPVVFQDVTKAAGLGSWRHVMGGPEKKFILESNGSGVGLIDYDNDGWLDIYLVNGSTFDALDGKETPPHAALFHNNHDGTFTDVAAQAGVTNDRWGFGVADWRLRQRRLAGHFCAPTMVRIGLYHNNHDGTFTDVARKGRRDTGQLVNGGGVGRLRRRWPAGSVCFRLRAL